MSDKMKNLGRDFADDQRELSAVRALIEKLHPDLQHELITVLPRCVEAFNSGAENGALTVAQESSATWTLILNTLDGGHTANITFSVTGVAVDFPRGDLINYVPTVTKEQTLLWQEIAGDTYTSEALAEKCIESLVIQRSDQP